MHYKETILQAFKNVKFEPRKGQLKIINDILTEYLINQKQNVILCADTGVGKSIIAAVTAEALDIIDGSCSGMKGVYISSTNGLVDQYAKTFESEPIESWHRIKGASNYPCQFFIKKGNPAATGEDCTWSDMTDLERDHHCHGCSYRKAKQAAATTDNLITNYSYFMIASYQTHQKSQRRLHVFDEAHLLNDQFCSHFGMTFSVDRMNKEVLEFQAQNGKLEHQAADLILKREEVKRKFVTKHNYREWLNAVYNIYKSAVTILTRNANLIPDLKDKKKVKKLASKYGRHMLMIQTLLRDGYDYVFDDTVENELSFKPIFIGKMINEMLGERNLFMTATMSTDYAVETMNLNPEKTAYIDAEQVFPSSNRPLLFIGSDYLNYNNMQKDSTFEELATKANLIIQHHKGQKGIMLVPSFSAGAKLAAKLKGTKVFEHRSGSKVGDVIGDFKRYKGQAILISPSIFEGLDFPGDDSRFQIIVKTPFPSLGDMRMKYIADGYSHIYKEISLYKILQGIGRSIRSEDDFSSTYFLDKSSERLFNDPANIWSHRFEVQS